jgi:tripartite-type tricarboxylate transporter receptor subunit TctC
MMTDGAFVLVGKKDFQVNTIAELFARIKADGEKISYAHAGVGSGSHLCGLMIMNAVGNRMNQIPYRGTGPAMSDVVAGKVDLLCDQITSALPQVQAGTVKSYAVTAKARVEGINLPTVAESGIPGFEVTVWHGLYAPKGTPADVVAKLNAALKAALKDPGIQKRLAELSTSGATEAQATPDFLRQHLASEIARWKGIIEKAGVSAE